MFTRKTVTVLITVVLCMTVFSWVAFADPTESTYYTCSILTIGSRDASVNDEYVELDVAPYEKAGRTLVPLRFAEKAFNAEVLWDEATQTATVNTVGKQVKVTIGQKAAQVVQNDQTQEVQLDVPAEIKNGRTFVPLRFVGESLGAVVQYEAKYKEIALIYTDKAWWNEFVDAGENVSIQYPPNWTVTGSTDTGIKFETPDQSVIELTTETKDLNTLVEERTKIFDDMYWSLYVKEPVKFAEGTRIFGANDMEGYFEEWYIFKIGNTVYIWHFKGWDETDQKIFRYAVSNKK